MAASTYDGRRGGGGGDGGGGHGGGWVDVRRTGARREKKKVERGKEKVKEKRGRPRGLGIPSCFRTFWNVLDSPSMESFGKSARDQVTN